MISSVKEFVLLGYGMQVRGEGTNKNEDTNWIEKNAYLRLGRLKRAEEGSVSSRVRNRAPQMMKIEKKNLWKEVKNILC